MALLPEGSLANVYASLDTYCQANILFADGTPISLKLHGVRRFIPPVDDPWVELYYDFLGLQSQYVRQVGGSNLGVHRSGHIQCNIYQRARVFTTRYTTAAIRDRVIAAFPEGGIVALYDYAGNTDPDFTPSTQVGYLILDGITERVTDHGDKSGVIQHVVQVATRYLEQFTRA